MLPQEVIRRKRDGEPLTAEEVAFIVEGLTSGAVSEGQAAAFAMAVFFRGMSRDEAVALTVASSAAFAQSGPWYVLHSDRSKDCFAAHRINIGGQEEMVAGPYTSQSAAISALDHTAACTGEIGAR